MTHSSVHSVLDFIDAINHHDVNRMALAVTDDYRFTDSIGGRFDGRANLRTGWDEYLLMFPDYNIEVDHVYCDGDTVAVFGVATGTYANEKWSLPASWRAEVRDGSILSWQVYADNGPVRDILAKDV